MFEGFNIRNNLIFFRKLNLNISDKELACAGDDVENEEDGDANGPGEEDQDGEDNEEVCSLKTFFFL